MIPLIGAIGWTEVLIIAAVVFLLFGASRIPMAFRSLGEGLRSFKDGLKGDEADEGGGSDKPAEAKASPAPSSESSGSAGKQG